MGAWGASDPSSILGTPTQKGMEENIYKKLLEGEIVILPTDTLYGIHASALNKKSVEKIYKIRGRAPEKPFIILIGSIEQLGLFKIKVDSKTKEILEKYWPGKVSIILPCPYKEFEYLHRGKNSLAFRLPRKKDLIDLLLKTGPLISTSVNPENKKPASTIFEAKKYFENKIKYYIDQGKLESLPSTVIEIKKGKTTIIRQGDAIIE